MKAVLLCTVPLLMLGCVPGTEDLVLNARLHPFQDHSHRKPDPKPGKNPETPFALDSGTVLLADFDGNLINRVTGVSGSMQAGAFAPALFGSGVRMQDEAEGKYWIDFANTEAFSLRSEIEGTLEALVKADSAQTGFAHIVEKAWQYGLTAYNGKLAVDFGTTWWYSPVTLPVGKWSYLAATYDGHILCLYLNGELAASTAYEGYRSYEYSTMFDLAVGNSSSVEFNLPFKGIVDAARVSRTVRTQAEIAATWAGIAECDR